MGVDIREEDFIFFYPVWSPEKNKWFLLIAINRNDWEEND